MREFPAERCVKDWLRVEYGIEVRDIVSLAEGADMHAVRYKVEGDRTYFVKVKRGHERGVNTTLLELLWGSGVREVIPPIKTREGRSELQMEHFCMVVYPFVEGVNGFSCRLTEQQWIALGRVLRQVHDFEVPSSVMKGIRQERYSSKWREAVCSLYDRESHDAIGLQFLNFIRENRPVIQRLVDRAEELSYSIKPTKFVLCHSDIHGGNVLLKGERDIYVVDWDDPIMAPKERDLMFIGGGVANVWNDPQEEAFFYTGYGRTDIDLPLLAYYRHERIVEDIAEYGEAFLTKSESVDRADMYPHFLHMFDPQGVVEIAFKTDKAAS